MCNAHHKSAPVTHTSLKIDLNEEGLRKAKRVFARVMPDVSSAHLGEALAVGLGQLTYAGLLTAMQHSSHERLGLDMTRMLNRLRRLGYADKDFGVLGTDKAEGLFQFDGHYRCTNPYCSYGPNCTSIDAGRKKPPAEREVAYSPHPEYRRLSSDGTINLSYDGLCLNCMDDERRDSEEANHF